MLFPNYSVPCCFLTTMFHAVSILLCSLLFTNYYVPYCLLCFPQQIPFISRFFPFVSLIHRSSCFLLFFLFPTLPTVSYYSFCFLLFILFPTMFSHSLKFLLFFTISPFLPLLLFLIIQPVSYLFHYFLLLLLFSPFHPAPTRHIVLFHSSDAIFMIIFSLSQFVLLFPPSPPFPFHFLAPQPHHRTLSRS